MGLRGRQLFKDEEFFFITTTVVHHARVFIVKDGLVENPEDYRFSSTRNYIIDDHFLINRQVTDYELPGEPSQQYSFHFV
jgi:hypothetical protein